MSTDMSCHFQQIKTMRNALTQTHGSVLQARCLTPVLHCFVLDTTGCDYDFRHEEINCKVCSHTANIFPVLLTSFRFSNSPFYVWKKQIILVSNYNEKTLHEKGNQHTASRRSCYYKYVSFITPKWLSNSKIWLQNDVSTASWQTVWCWFIWWRRPDHQWEFGEMDQHKVLQAAGPDWPACPCRSLDRNRTESNQRPASLCVFVSSAEDAEEWRRAAVTLLSSRLDEISRSTLSSACQLTGSACASAADCALHTTK